VLCSVVVLELLYGVEHSPPAHRAANLALVVQVRQQYVSLPFDDSAAEDAAKIRGHLAALGKSHRALRSLDFPHCPSQPTYGGHSQHE